MWPVMLTMDCGVTTETRSRVVAMTMRSVSSAGPIHVSLLDLSGRNLIHMGIVIFDHLVRRTVRYGMSFNQKQLFLVVNFFW